MKRARVRKQKRNRLWSLALACVLAGVALVGFSLVGSNTSRMSPPVRVIMNESAVVGINGIYYDKITVQNLSGGNVTVVVAIKTRLDSAERMSLPVTICGGCKATISIREVQPPPGEENDYYVQAVENPTYIRAEYPPTPIMSFASYAEPLGLGTLAIGLVLMIYLRPNRS